MACQSIKKKKTRSTLVMMKQEDSSLNTALKYAIHNRTREDKMHGKEIFYL